MLAYRTPGVYFERVDTGPSGLEPLRTDIAAFVGIAAYGPLHKPVEVESWTQFTSFFGGHIPHGFLAYAVEGFFANGGKTCWVVRVADPEKARLADVILETGSQSVRLTATEPGVLVISVLKSGNGRLVLTIARQDGAQEVWRNLTLTEGDSRYIASTLNDETTGSQWIRVRAQKPKHGWPASVGRLKLSEKWCLRSGDSGLSTIKPAHFTGIGAPISERWGWATLELVDEVSMIAAPDVSPKPYVEATLRRPQRRCQVLDGDPLTLPVDPECLPVVRSDYARSFDEMETSVIQQALIDHCEKLKDRIAILDIPPRSDAPSFDRTPEQAINWRNQFDSKYAALYYPRVLVPDPLRLDGILRSVPPSGHIAGVYARATRQVGVHKPPANEVVESVKDVLVQVNDVEHGYLNQEGVNVVRSFPGRGIRVAGARTVSSQSEWRYVNVRRLLIMIEESIEQQLQWTVFEPNNPDLWRDIDRVVRSFLNELWRRGQLDGATPEQAYDVICDDTTNPSRETGRGRIVCEIGVQPPWPAEFVIVRIGITENGTELIEA